MSSNYGRLLEALNNTVNEYVNYLLDSFFIRCRDHEHVINDMYTHAKNSSILITEVNPEKLGDEIVRNIRNYCTKIPPIISFNNVEDIEIYMVLPREVCQASKTDYGRFLLNMLGVIISKLSETLQYMYSEADYFRYRLPRNIVLFYLLDNQLMMLFNMSPDRRTLITYCPSITDNSIVLSTLRYNIMDIPQLSYPSMELEPVSRHTRISTNYLDTVFRCANIRHELEEKLVEQYGEDIRSIFDRIYITLLQFVLKYPTSVNYLRRIILLLSQLDRQHIHAYEDKTDKDSFFTLLYNYRTIMNQITPLHGYYPIKQINEIINQLLTIRP